MPSNLAHLLAEQPACLPAALVLVAAARQLNTAKLNGLDLEAYIAAVIARIADHPVNRVDELLPWRITDQVASDNSAPHRQTFRRWGITRFQRVLDGILVSLLQSC